MRAPASKQSSAVKPVSRDQLASDSVQSSGKINLSGSMVANSTAELRDRKHLHENGADRYTAENKRNAD